MPSFIIYRTLDRDGQTFAVEPLSAKRLKQTFRDHVRTRPIVFIAHPEANDQPQLHEDVIDLVIQLLTSLSKEKLIEAFGVVSVQDSIDLEEILRFENAARK